ncbi:MAG: SusC/RagA family TonB-linked outer membrane protein [Flavobacteriaceae bacterium]|nr:SusC/RagA family TonB-linked outer membrane protein [Flavobacteriaceae bacterium]
MKKIRGYSNLLEIKFGAITKLSFVLILGSILQINASVLESGNLKIPDTFSETPVQQTREISGIVLDEQGIPLAGVSVLVEGTTIGDVTNFDGKYLLKVPSNAKILVFSYVGFITEKVKINNKINIDVVLKEDLNILNEVVVTGYQTISKERATGSFSKINEAQLEMRPVQNIVDRLEGTVSGLNYTNGQVEIRGQSSINASTQPLYIVDGFPIEGDLETINPEDVESITVLKDASAASIWGVRASNGVVVVVTKKGKKGQKLQVDFSSYLALTDKIDYSDMGWMSTSEQIDLELEYTEKGWNNYSTMVGRLEGMSLLDEANVLVRGLAPNGDRWSQAQYDAFLGDLRTKSTTDQWERYLLRSPLENTYNLAIYGGSDKNTFRASLVYNDNTEASIGDSNNRFNINLQDNYRLSDRIGFTAGINATLRNNKTNGVDYTTAYNEDAYNNLVDPSGQTIQYYNRWNRWVSQEREALPGVGLYSFNQLDQQRYSDRTSQEFDVRARFGLDIEIVKDLVFNSSFQYEKGNTNFDQFNSMNLPSQRIRVWDMYADPDLTDDKDEVDHIIPLGTEYKYTRTNFYAWDLRNTLTWDKEWNIHKLTVFGGTEIRKRYSESFNDKKYGYDKQTTTYVPVNQEAFLSGSLFNWNGNRFRDRDFYENSNTDDREVSVFSNVGYEFDNRFSVTGSFRIDQKNLFGSDPAFRYKPLWSTGVAWNITNETFMDNIDKIDRLRLRATYGLTGNASNKFSPYAQATNYTRSWGTNLYNYLRLTQPANDKLKWEETTTLNIALDFAMFKNRLSGTIEYYDKNSTDLLGPRQLDVTNGFRSAVINYASMRNNGIEFSLNGLIINNGGFTWNSSLNFSYNKNEVTEIDDQLQTPWTIIRNGLLEVGSAFNNVYSYNYAGLDAGGNILVYNTDGTTKSWRDGVNDQEELIYQGLSVAPFYGGFTNVFAYKGFDLAINLTYKLGHVFRNTSYGTSFSGWNNRSNKIFLDRWKKPGDELTTRIPKVAYEGTNPYTGESESHWDSTDGDRFWEYSQDNVLSANFIRVRDIILGYTMPGKFLEKTFIKKFRITGQVANPFVWVANDLGIDPESFNSSGSSRLAYNNLKTFTFGVRLTF